MPYETRAQLIARLAKVDAALDAARVGDFNVADRGMRKSGVIESLHKEREEILRKLDRTDGAGGFTNKVQFGRPA